MEERKRELDAFEKKKSEHSKIVKELKEKVTKAKDTKPCNFDELKKALEEAEKEADDIKKQEEELRKKDKVRKSSNRISWYVICILDDAMERGYN